MSQDDEFRKGRATVLVDGSRKDNNVMVDNTGTINNNNDLSYLMSK